MPIIIAIDGPAASGKGTLAKSIATEMKLPYLDTGSLYRAAASRSIATGEDPVQAAQKLSDEDFRRSDLRSPEISQEASRISAIPEVREALNQYQIDFAHGPSGAVLDGRDIGTVIAPDADVKLYITADREVRAKRRLMEILASGEIASLNEVIDEMQIRDQRDSSRSTSPLMQAEDAVRIDTTYLTLDEAREIVFASVDAGIRKAAA